MVATLTPYAADKGKHSVMQPAGSSPVQYHWVSEVKWFWLTWCGVLLQPENTEIKQTRLLTPYEI